MDDETRFWVARQLAKTKYTADTTYLFKKGNEIAEINPNTWIRYGVPNFHPAYNKEFYTNTKPKKNISIIL